MYYRDYSVSKFAKGGEIAKDIKVPKYILLNVSIEKIKQQELPRMEVIGGIKMIEYAKKYKIPPLRNDDYKLKIEDGKVYMLLTKDGQMAIRVASKSINDYLEKITKVANETFKDYISNKKFAKGGNLEGITEKDFANNRVIKKGNIEIELSKDYPTEYYAFFVDMSKDGGELISVYANKNWNKVVKEIETFKYEIGGMVAKGGEINNTDNEHPFKVGDILYDSWGFEQTNIDFYQVIDVKDKTIKITPIEKKSDSAKGSHTAYVQPVKNAFKGKPMTKKILYNKYSKYHIKSKYGTFEKYKDDEKIFSSSYA